MSTSFLQPELLAMRLAGPDAPPEIVWREKKGAPTMSSPLVVEDLVYMVSDKGVATCLATATGEQVWSQRLGGNFSSSPLFADGRIYVGNRDGDTIVIRPGREYDLVATNHLDGGIYATPAVVGRAIYVRTENALYRIEKPADAVSAAPSATRRDGSTPAPRHPRAGSQTSALAVSTSTCCSRPPATRCSCGEVRAEGLPNFLPPTTPATPRL